MLSRLLVAQILLLLLIVLIVRSSLSPIHLHSFTYIVLSLVPTNSPQYQYFSTISQDFEGFGQQPSAGPYCKVMSHQIFNVSKVCFKMRETNCKIWNIFANSHLMHVLSIVLDSEHYIDNFQPVFVAKTAKFDTKRKAGKFFVF